MDSWKRELAEKPLTRFAPTKSREAVRTPVRASLPEIPMADDMCEHARARLAADTPPSALAAHPPEHLAEAPAPAPVAPTAPAPQAASPEEDEDIPISVLRSALPQRFAKLDAAKRETGIGATDMFFFKASG